MKTSPFSRKALLLSLALLIFGFLVFLWLEKPLPVYQYYQNVLSFKQAEPTESPPVSEDFSLVIPKININAPVLPNVDGANPKEYLWKVTQGIAHFKHQEFDNVTVDGAFPGEGGNIFLFGHSQIPGGDTSDYKGAFNDLHKLANGDKVIVYYQKQRFEYRVIEGRVVSKQALEYLAPTEEEVLTLMTCWPLGLDVGRYVVRARRAP